MSPYSSKKRAGFVLTGIGAVAVVIVMASGFILPALGYLGGDAPDEWPLEEEEGKGLPDRRGTKAPREPKPRNAKREATGKVAAQTSGRMPAVEPDTRDERQKALQARGIGLLRLRVVDRSTGRPIEDFGVKLAGPGYQSSYSDATGGRAEVELRVGMPANLRVTAKGYEPAELRQVLLEAKSRLRELGIELAPSR